MAAPFDLESGLRLEKANVLLPWDTPAESLMSLGSPELFRHSKTVDARWCDEIFGGLSVQVDKASTAGANVFYLQRTSLAGSAQEEYSELLAILQQKLGTPHSTVIDDGYPWTRWAWGTVVVSLRITERFTEYVAFMVSKNVVRV